MHVAKTKFRRESAWYDIYMSKCTPYHTSLLVHPSELEYLSLIHLPLLHTGAGTTFILGERLNKFTLKRSENFESQPRDLPK